RTFAAFAVSVMSARDNRRKAQGGFAEGVTRHTFAREDGGLRYANPPYTSLSSAACFIWPSSTAATFGGDIGRLSKRMPSALCTAVATAGNPGPRGTPPPPAQP